MAQYLVVYSQDNTITLRDKVTFLANVQARCHPEKNKLMLCGAGN